MSPAPKPEVSPTAKVDEKSELLRLVESRFDAFEADLEEYHVTQSHILDVIKAVVATSRTMEAMFHRWEQREAETAALMPRLTKAIETLGDRVWDALKSKPPSPFVVHLWSHVAQIVVVAATCTLVTAYMTKQDLSATGFGGSFGATGRATQGVEP